MKRWFRDILKEAKAGDINMQVLVGQMYYSGYGVPRDDQKGSVSVSMSLFHSRLCFVCSHLTSGQKDVSSVLDSDQP